jgi:hypothetical protein
MLTGLEVEESFPEGGSIEFGLRGSIKQTRKRPEGWDW